MGGCDSTEPTKILILIPWSGYPFPFGQDLTRRVRLGFLPWTFLLQWRRGWKRSHFTCFDSNSCVPIYHLLCCIFRASSVIQDSGTRFMVGCLIKRGIYLSIYHCCFPDRSKGCKECRACVLQCLAEGRWASSLHMYWCLTSWMRYKGCQVRSGDLDFLSLSLIVT